MKREQAYDLASEFFGLALPHYIADWVVPAIMEAVAIEREACAKVCEELDSPYWDDLDPVMECAKQIRARGGVP